MIMALLSNSTFRNDSSRILLNTRLVDNEKSEILFDSVTSPRFLSDLFQFDWNFFEEEESEEEEEVTKRPKKKKKKTKKKQKKRKKSRYFITNLCLIHSTFWCWWFSWRRRTKKKKTSRPSSTNLDLQYYEDESESEDTDYFSDILKALGVQRLWSKISSYFFDEDNWRNYWLPKSKCVKILQGVGDYKQNNATSPKQNFDPCKKYQLFNICWSIFCIYSKCQVI